MTYVHMLTAIIYGVTALHKRLYVVIPRTGVLCTKLLLDPLEMKLKEPSRPEFHLNRPYININFYPWT